MLQSPMDVSHTLQKILDTCVTSGPASSLEVPSIFMLTFQILFLYQNTVFSMKFSFFSSVYPLVPDLQTSGTSEANTYSSLILSTVYESTSDCVWCLNPSQLWLVCESKAAMLPKRGRWSSGRLAIKCFEMILKGHAMTIFPYYQSLEVYVTHLNS